MLVLIAPLLAAGLSLGDRVASRVSSLAASSDPRLQLLLPVLDNATTAAQALAVNNLLGVNFVHDPVSLRPALSAASGMCRLGTTRPWSFPTDHGLRCNQVLEWFFAVGTFDLPEAVVGYELMFAFQQLTPAKCDCEYDPGYVPSGTPRLNDVDGRLVEVQFSVISRAKQNGSAVHVQAPEASRWWTGLAADEKVNRPWGFRVGNYSITAETTDLNKIFVEGSDESTGLAVNLTLQRGLPPMFQGGTGYIGAPEAGNGQGYYSLVGLQTEGTLRSAGQEFTVERGLSWMDHQFGSIGPDLRAAQRAFDYAAYAVGGINLNPVNMGFGVPGTENWFGFHFTDTNGSYMGAFSGNLVDYQTWDKRSNASGACSVGQWLDASGTQVMVNYT